MNSEKKTQKTTPTGTRNSKEYKDRWIKPLVNPPITVEELEWQKKQKEHSSKEWP